MATRLTLNSIPSPVALLQNLADFILDRSPAGERHRFWLAVCVFLAYWLLIVWLEDVPPSAWVAEAVSTSPEGMRPALEWLGNRMISFISPQVLRHLPFPILGLLAALRVGASYLQDLFELKNVGVAYDYLLGATLGRSQGGITIKDGTVVEKDHENPVYLIGGPGYVTIQLGNAAVFERVGGGTHVLPQGRHRLHGYERLREVVDLRDQHGVVEKLQFTTRDGMPVEASDLQVRFRVHSNRKRRESDPYPYEDTSVRRAVYGNAVNEKGQGTWARSVPGFVRNRARAHLSRFTLEELLQPQSADNVRMTLTHLFYTPETRGKVENMGARIDWVGVGTIIAGDDVTRQFLAHWQEEQKRLQLTRDPAWRIRRQSETRDTVQWNVIKQITMWFRSHREEGTLTGHSFLRRYAQVLEGLCEAHPLGIEPCDEETLYIISFLYNPVDISLLERGLPPPALFSPGSESKSDD